MTTKPVILAEDNDKLRRLYAETLEAKGFHVAQARDGEKAVGLLHKIAEPHLIILDILMPRLDGIEACKRMRKMQGVNSQCPIIFLTALDNPQTLLDCLRAGGDDLVMKSTPMSEILQRIQFWAHQGSCADIGERRNRAIKELEEINAEAASTEASGDSAGSTQDQVILKELAEFIDKNAPFGEEDSVICRFGYVVGLVDTSYNKGFEHSHDAVIRFLRNLIYKIELIASKEVDALLQNYQRIITQKQFQEGWARGRVDGCALESESVDGTQRP